MEAIEVIAGVLTNLTDVIKEQNQRIAVLEGKAGDQGNQGEEKVKEATREELDAIMKDWRI